MRSDLKIGMLIGVAIVIIATFVIFKLPGGSVEDRLKNKKLQEEKSTGSQIENRDTNKQSHDDNSEEITKSQDNSQADNEKLQQVLDRLYS